MSTPQNPNDPTTGQPDQSESNSGAQDSSVHDHGQDQPTAHDSQSAPDTQSADGQPTPQQTQNDYSQAGQSTQYDYQQPGQDAHGGYQQGTYDPNAYQQQGSQQGAYAQPDAYQQGAYQQGYNQADGYQQAYAQPGAYGQPGYAPAPQSGTGEKGFFKSLFDFRFDSFIAVKWAGFIYIIAIIVAALSYIGTIVAGISAGVAAGSAMSYYSGPSFNILPLILSIVFGWIIPVLWVIGVRLVLELIVSNIKTAENTKRIADSVSR